MGGNFGVDDPGDVSDVEGVDGDFGVDKKHTATTMQTITAATIIQKAGFL
jgi:hypothetical protein